MKYFPLYLLVFLIFLSCSGDNSENANVTIKEDSDYFNDYKSLVNNKDLPLLIDCDFNQSRLFMDFTGFENFIPKGATPFFEIEVESEYSLIVYVYACDYFCPYVFSYNQDGEIIDSLSLVSACGEDEFGKRRGATNIESNLTFELTDTMYITKPDAPDSLSIIIEKFVLNEQGKFENIGVEN